jgi:hypothetical protein
METIISQQAEALINLYTAEIAEKLQSENN